MVWCGLVSSYTNQVCLKYMIYAVGAEIVFWTERDGAKRKEPIKIPSWFEAVRTC